jgi:hypothetical protein
MVGLVVRREDSIGNSWRMLILTFTDRREKTEEVRVKLNPMEDFGRSYNSWCSAAKFS